MKDQTFEQRWAEILNRRTKNLSHLISVGVLEPVDPRSLHRSNDHVVVGTIVESTETQRDGRLFSRPTSRQELLDSFKT